MLDKSVPYVDILMRRKPNLSPPQTLLPDGYSFDMFQKGDEKHWAEIEASVLEFDSPLDAFIYFQKKFLPLLGELERRCIFIKANSGEKVATSMAWWSYTGNRRDPWIHWVAVKPEHQGKGLGKAIISKAIRLMSEIEGERDIYLHTQTWSHKAVKLYEKMGFYITSRPNLYKYHNKDYKKAIAILEAIDKNKPIPI